MTPAQAARESLRAARRWSGTPDELRRLLRDADALLSRRLGRMARLAPEMRFSEAQVVQYREQIGLVLDALDRNLLALTQQRAESAAASGLGRTTRVLQGLETHFTGVSQPLDLDTARQLSRSARGIRASLLQQHRTSIARYGQSMIGEFERIIQSGFVGGAPQLDVIRGLVSAAPPDIASTLWRQAPKWFPDPKTGFVRRQYWAERIVRTETAYAYESANQEAMETHSERIPGLKRKILAYFDRRTAPDSIGVHGQIRGIKQNFEDGAGRSYLHPPARPNDRETVIPWRDHWDEDASTRPATAADISRLARRQA